MGWRGRTRALAALTIACALLGVGGATANAGSVTGVTATYQGSTVAGDVIDWVTLDFTLQSSLMSGQTITVRGPPGSDLRPRSSTSFSLAVGAPSWALHSYRLSDGNSTITFSLPVPVTQPVFTQLTLPATTNPPLGGSYRWAVSTSLDTAAESQAVTIAPRPLSALTVTGGDSQRTPVAQPFGEPLSVRTSDDLGNPVAPAAPVAVTFTVAGGRASATFPGGATSATVTSDANGIATAPALTANTVAGSFEVTAASAGLTGTSATLRNGAGAPDSIALTIEPSLVFVLGMEPGQATVDLRDAYGNVVKPDDLTGGDPQLSAVGGASTSDLAFGEDGSWRGLVFATGSPGRSIVTASIGALTATAPFDCADKPLLGLPLLSGLTATTATVALPLTTRNAETTYRVQYGTTVASEQTTAARTAARDATPGALVSVPLTGLAPQTTYVYRVLAWNALGSAQTEVRTFTTPAAPVDPPAGPPGGGGGGGGATPPAGGGDATPRPAPAGAARLSAARLSPRAFRTSGRRAGTTLRFALDRAATVGAKVEARHAGVRVRGRCVAPRRGGRGARCVRWRAAGSLSLDGRSGANSVRLAGRFGGRALAPGSYRLTLTPAGGSATTVAFTVKR